MSSSANSRAHLEPLGIADDVAALVAASASAEELAARLPDEWIDELVVVGDVARCAAKIAALHKAGADVVLVGIGPDVEGDARNGAWRDLSTALGRSAS